MKKIDCFVREYFENGNKKYEKIDNIDLGSGIAGDAILLINSYKLNIIDDNFFQKVRKKIISSIVNVLQKQEITIGLWSGLSGVGVAIQLLDIDGEYLFLRKKILDKVVLA